MSVDNFVDRDHLARRETTHFGSSAFRTWLLGLSGRLLQRQRYAHPDALRKASRGRLTISSGTGFSGDGSISDHVNYYGTISAATGGGINLTGGVTVSATGSTAGSVSLGSGNFTVNNTSGTSGMSAGSLSAASGYLGYSGTGTFNQSGGTIVGAGTLALTSNSSLPGGSSLTVGTGGTLIFEPSVAGANNSTFVAAPDAGAAVVAEPGTPALLAVAGIVAAAATWRRRKKGVARKASVC